jgi:hypothetical protein
MSVENNHCPGRPLKRLRLAQTSRPIDVIIHWKREGYLELSPPYQRGDVWGPIRKRNLIRSLLTGVPIPSLIVNDRFSAGWGTEISVIDGKQRMTAVIDFIEGKIQAPGEWFGMDVGMVAFDSLPIAQQRSFRLTPIQIAEGNLGTIEEEIEVFELVNFGGVPQGQTDYAGT